MVTEFKKDTSEFVTSNIEDFRSFIGGVLEEKILTEIRRKIAYSKKLSKEEKHIKKSVIDERIICIGSISAQELEPDSCMQDIDLDGDTVPTPKSIDSVQISSVKGSLESPMLEMSAEQPSKSQSESTSSPAPLLANPSPSKDSEGDGETVATVSHPSLNLSPCENPDSLLLKTSPDSSVAMGEETTNESLNPLIEAGTTQMRSSSKVPTLELPGWVQGSSLLPRPGAMSSRGSNPPGQTKFEVACKERGLIQKGEVLNPEAGEQLFGLPVGWTDPSEQRPATELIALEDPRWGMPSIPELLTSPCKESNTLPEEVVFFFEDRFTAWEAPKMVVADEVIEGNKFIKIISHGQIYRCKQGEVLRCDRSLFGELDKIYEEYCEEVSRAKRFIADLGDLQPGVKYAIFTPKVEEGYLSENYCLEAPFRKFLEVVEFGEEYTLVKTPDVDDEPRSMATSRLTACASSSVYQRFNDIWLDVDRLQKMFRMKLEHRTETYSPETSKTKEISAIQEYTFPIPSPPLRHRAQPVPSGSPSCKEDRQEEISPLRGSPAHLAGNPHMWLDSPLTDIGEEPRKSVETNQKQELEELVISGIENGKRGFQQAAQALLRIDELGLWRDEAKSFDQYRDKFREMLADTDLSFRRLNQLVASVRVITILGTIVPSDNPPRESHLRPLTGLKNPDDIQKAYKTAVSIAQKEGEELKAEHVKRAVEEINPPKIRNSGKPPRIPAGAKVRVLPHYADEEFHGAEGVVMQHPERDRSIVRFEDETSKLIPDNMLVIVEEIREATSIQQENKQVARSLGLRDGNQILPDLPRNEGIPTIEQQTANEVAIASFLRILPKLSFEQKNLVYEQLLKSGFMPEERTPSKLSRTGVAA